MERTAKKGNIGLSPVHDDRLNQLAAQYNPKVVTPAIITYLLLPKLSKNSEENREIEVSGKTPAQHRQKCRDKDGSCSHPLRPPMPCRHAADSRAYYDSKPRDLNLIHGNTI